MTLGIFQGKVVFPSLKREISLSHPRLVRPSPPSSVTISLSQHQGSPALPCVAEGAQVRVGTMIGRPDGNESAAVHASVSGVVRRIGLAPHPFLGEALAVEIESDGSELQEPAEAADPGRLGEEEIYRRLQASGLVELGGDPVPLHLKLNPWSKPRVDTVLLNGLDCEPYQVANYLLLMERPYELIRGAKILRRLLGAERVVLAVGEKSLEGLETVNSKLFALNEEVLTSVALPDDYPQGEDHQLIRALLSKKLPRGEDPRAIGVVILHVETVIALYEAVAMGKPFYERVVTVTGECVVQPKNLVARIGTPLQDLIRSCQGFLREPGRLVARSVMTGTPQENLEAPVVKSLNALIALPAEDTSRGPVEPCIRCGFCVDACPAQINPCMITMAAESVDYALAEEFGVADCVHCGNCTYVCPSYRPMADLIRQAEEALVRP